MAKVKMTGAEFKAFWNGDWSDLGREPVVEDEIIYVDGNETEDPDFDQISDAAKIEVGDGVIYADASEFHCCKTFSLTSYA